MVNQTNGMAVYSSYQPTHSLIWSDNNPPDSLQIENITVRQNKTEREKIAIAKENKTMIAFSILAIYILKNRKNKY